jgi:hypothetical protein
LSLSKPSSNLRVSDALVPGPEKSEVFRCDVCGKPLFVGRLGPGSNLSAKCPNRRCVRHRESPYCRIVIL